MTASSAGLKPCVQILHLSAVWRSDLRSFRDSCSFPSYWSVWDLLYFLTRGPKTTGHCDWQLSSLPRLVSPHICSTSESKKQKSSLMRFSAHRSCWLGICVPNSYKIWTRTWRSPVTCSPAFAVTLHGEKKKHFQVTALLLGYKNYTTFGWPPKNSETKRWGYTDDSSWTQQSESILYRRERLRHGSVKSRVKRRTNLIT